MGTIEDQNRSCADSRKRIALLFEECGPTIIALGDETRQAIVIALLDAGAEGMRVGELKKRTNLSRPAVSHHLKVLKDTGIVAVRKQGTMNFYYLNASTGSWTALGALGLTVAKAAERARDAGYPENCL